MYCHRIYISVFDPPYEAKLFSEDSYTWMSIPEDDIICGMTPQMLDTIRGTISRIEKITKEVRTYLYVEDKEGFVPANFQGQNYNYPQHNVFMIEYMNNKKNINPLNYLSFNEAFPDSETVLAKSLSSSTNDRGERSRGYINFVFEILDPSGNQVFLAYPETDNVFYKVITDTEVLKTIVTREIVEEKLFDDLATQNTLKSWLSLSKQFMNQNLKVENHYDFISSVAQRRGFEFVDLRRIRRRGRNKKSTKDSNLHVVVNSIGSGGHSYPNILKVDEIERIAGGVLFSLKGCYSCCGSIHLSSAKNHKKHIFPGPEWISPDDVIIIKRPIWRSTRESISNGFSLLEEITMPDPYYVD